MNVRSCWQLVPWFVALALAGCSEGGPSGTPTDPTPVTFWSYSLSLEQTWMVDLDSGARGASMASDLWFEAVGGGERYLSPMNGAKMALAGTTAPGLNGCVAATVTFSRIPINSLTTGRYLCAYTNQYRWAEIRIDQAAPDYVPGSGIAPALKMTVTVH
jgi:hypothetical protein